MVECTKMRNIGGVIVEIAGTIGVPKCSVAIPLISVLLLSKIGTGLAMTHFRINR